MENIDDFKYVYGEPFRGFYEKITPSSIWNLSYEHPSYSTEELNDIYRKNLKSHPIAKWNGSIIYEEDALMLFKEKMELLNQITKDITEIEQSKNPYIERFNRIVKYLILVDIDISTFRPKSDIICREKEIDSSIIKEISSAKEIIRVSKEVRTYISKIEYANTLRRQIEELTRIYDSLKNAPELDVSNMSLYQEEKTKIKQ